MRMRTQLYLVQKIFFNLKKKEKIEEEEKKKVKS